ncbi:MAG: hypothetical protein B7Z80_15705 [Rhodospirillales bacterium 20-64-7]|nr:MAG: hypothetical protein B7Z80_15705 [Rhodospirillales bacterium 20-64-7]
MSLDALIAQLRGAAGTAHKRDIAPVLQRLGLGAQSAVAVGDDCAALPDGDGFLLLAIEGFMPGFIAADPYFAGFCGVMVNLSDIAAMGGRAVAVVDAIWSSEAQKAAPILDGLAAAAEAYGVPVVGGHSNTRAPSELLSVAILGRARRLLTSFDARPGDTLVAAVDLRGTLRSSGPYWDAASSAPPARLRGDLALLPWIAESGLAIAAKDISMAGVVGTAMMLLEASRLGGVIDLDALPRPADIPLARWLPAFPSFGFVLSVPPDHVAEVIGTFRAQGIAAAAIGHTDASRRLRLRHEGLEAPAWDFTAEPFVGCVPEPSLA